MIFKSLMNTPAALPHPWTEDDIRLLASSRDFRHIGDIVLDVACRTSGQLVMVSGPMTSGGKGSVEANMAAYKRAMAHLQSKGYPIFNQLPGEDALKRHWRKWYDDGNKGYCWKLLDGVYSPIFCSGRVVKLVFMPNWQSSLGATWEHAMADNLGIDREYLPVDWE